MKTLDTSRALRRAAFERAVWRQRKPLTLPAAPPPAEDTEDLRALAGCLTSIGIVLGITAVAWISIIGLAWIITGWLL